MLYPNLSSALTPRVFRPSPPLFFFSSLQPHPIRHFLSLPPFVPSFPYPPNEDGNLAVVRHNVRQWMGMRNGPLSPPQRRVETEALKGLLLQHEVELGRFKCCIFNTVPPVTSDSTEGEKPKKICSCKNTLYLLIYRRCEHKMP